MKVLAFDVSTKTGYAVFNNDGQKNSLIKYGLVTLPKKIGQNGNYPFGFLLYVQELVDKLIELVNLEDPDVLVIEETTGAGRASRYSLKALEFLHCTILTRLNNNGCAGRPKVCYVNPSEWRHALGLVMSKEDKKNNKLLKLAKKVSEANKSKLDKAKLGIKGSITKKHLSVRYVNETYGLDLLIGNNDIADAICLGTAYLKGCGICNGK